MYILALTTDWDLSVEYQGKIYADNDIELRVSGFKALQNIVDTLRGPFGAKEGGKYYDVKMWLQEIIDDKIEEFSMLGGNREVEWYKEVKRGTKYRHIKVRNFPLSRELQNASHKETKIE